MSLTCLSESDLLLFALSGEVPSDTGKTVHLKGCAICLGRVADLRQVVRGLEVTATTMPGPGECLDEVSLAELASGTGLSETPEDQLTHLAGCGHCRRQLAGLIELLADAGVAAELRRVESASPQPGTRRKFLAAAGIVAAAAAILLLVQPTGPDVRDGHRGPTITAGTVPTPILPIGITAEARAFQWASVAGADRYRVTLFDATGKLLYEIQTQDTTANLPDSLTIPPGQLYLWKVEARTGWERWTSSDFIEFRVGAGKGTSAMPVPDSLRELAHRLSDSALTIEIHRRPLEVRDALAGTLALVVSGTPSVRDAELNVAHRIAAAYDAAWHDGFLVREVNRFSEWPAERRAAKVQADSTRRAGIVAFSHDGARAAIAIWHRALGRSTAIPDTAGMAATLGNIGAGLAYDDRPDSAETCLERSRLLAEAVGDLRVEANAFGELAGVREQRDDVAGARQYYARAIDLRKRIGDSRGLASDYNNLAGLARAAGDFDEAGRQLEAALALNQRDGRTGVAATNLVNLAALASMSGDFARAEALYRRAAATWRSDEQWADLADALRGLGELGLRRGDYPAARADLLEALALYDRTGPAASAFAVRQEVASSRAAQGDLQGALDDLRRAQSLADSARVGAEVQAGIALGRADLAAQLNRQSEAERLYASAELLYQRAGNRAGEAEAQSGQGKLLVEQGKSARGLELLTQALGTQQAAGNRRAAALTRLSLGDVLLSRGDTVGARRQMAGAAADLIRLGDPVAAGAALGERAALEAAARLPAAAESLFRVALTTVGERSAPDVTWRLHAGLAEVRRDRGAIDEAAGQFRAAIADIERAGRTIALAERRSGYFTDKWDAYVELALLERSRGRSGIAFGVSERIRAGEMLELLAQGRVSAPADTAAELVGREQDLRRRLAELAGPSEGGAAGRVSVRGPDLAGGGPVTREALLRAQESYSDLMLEIRDRAPRHAALVSRETVGWSEVARRLNADEALIEYLVSDQGSIAFVVTRDTLAALPLGVSRRDLARSIEFVRGTLEPRGGAGLDSLWRAPLRQLYGDLITPVENTGLLAGKTRLIIVPHAELHYLPFAALVGGTGPERFLVERFQVMVTPSASVWLALGARPRDHSAEGVLAFAPRPDALPATRQEVAAIGRLGGADARLVVGAGATEAAFRREAPSRRLIHLATYGVLNKQNPLFSYVELAPDGANDGRLEVHELFGLPLSADLVVLSACQTGLGSGALTDVPAGDDWVGLARGILSAGAAKVIATLWPVQDRASAALMEEFYREFRVGADPGPALAKAQRALLAQPGTASPYFWAGFELVGGR